MFYKEHKERVLLQNSFKSYNYYFYNKGLHFLY